MANVAKNILGSLRRFMYGTWYGAMAVFAVVTFVLCGLQLVNSDFEDVVAWPTQILHVLMLIALVNVGTAMLFSLSRCKWGRGCGQFLLCCVAFFCFIIYSLPRSMTAESSDKWSVPSDKWVESTICTPTAITRDKLSFLGGTSQRETIAVFAISDVELDKGRFSSGSPRNLGGADKAINHYRRIMKRSHIDVALPDDARIVHCNSSTSYLISIVEANGRRYLFCERL